MSAAVHLIPVAISAIGWYGIYRLNRGKGWLRIGEVIFWDAILLILVFLLWVKWF